jgi:ketosteroid isomerase-like protein
VDEVFAADAGDRVAVRGRLQRSDGTISFGFVDVFSVEDGRLARLVTYTNRRVE